MSCSCVFSKMDCRDIDDVSVMLPVSPPSEGAGPCPVINSLLKASTSMPALLVGDACSPGLSAPSLASRSMSSSVF